MGSFKLKLVGYFLLLSLLPLAAAFWGFSAVAAKSETRRVDARLQAGLRAALVAYDERLAAAQRSATALARDRTFQAELYRRDRNDLARTLRDAPDLYVTTPYGFAVGRAPRGRRPWGRAPARGPGSACAASAAGGARCRRR